MRLKFIKNIAKNLNKLAPKLSRTAHARAGSVHSSENDSNSSFAQETCVFQGSPKVESDDKSSQISYLTSSSAAIAPDETVSNRVFKALNIVASTRNISVTSKQARASQQRAWDEMSDVTLPPELEDLSGFEVPYVRDDDDARYVKMLDSIKSEAGRKTLAMAYSKITLFQDKNVHAEYEKRQQEFEGSTRIYIDEGLKARSNHRNGRESLIL